ncbi:hypothetical protein Tco_1230705 [Tanacetum coccineum]
METQKPLLKDEDGKEVDVNMYRLMIGSLMYLTSSRPDIMFPVCACARYQVNPKVSHLHAVKRIFRYLKGQPQLGLWYPKDSPFDLVAYTDSDYTGASLDKKYTTGDLLTKAFDVSAVKYGMELELMLFWATGMVKTVNGEVQLHALVDEKKVIVTEASIRRDLWLGDEEDKAVHKELGDSLVRAATTASSLGAEQDSVLDLETTKTSQQSRIVSLEKSVKKLERRKRSTSHGLKRLYKGGLNARIESSNEDLGKDASKQGRINAIDADDDITLGVNVSEVVKEVVKAINTAKLIVDSAQVSAAGDIVSATSDAETISAAPTTTAATTVEEITLAQALEKVKSTKPKAKEKLEERLAKEEAEKIEKANIALIETWDEIQVKIDTDYQLAKRLQAEEQEELSVEERDKLFQQLLDTRRKHFAAKRAEEKRNKPPTKAQQRKIVCNYLKNMERHKLKDLKLKDFDVIQKMFDRAFKRGNTFNDFRSELLE